MKLLLSALMICAGMATVPAYAKDGENARLIGALIGGILGGGFGPHHPHPYPGPYPGGPYPGPGPGPGPNPGPGPGPYPGPGYDLCAGTYGDQYGNTIVLNAQGNGNVLFTVNGRGGSFSGWGTCWQRFPGRARFQFTIQFNGAVYQNNGMISMGNDGRAYLQGQQNGGQAYTFVRW